MDDYGANNTAIGHRRWILYSNASVFGHGATDYNDALWVLGTATPRTIAYTAYPSPGFFPAPLVPSSNRWSFSKAGADFSSASIEMRDPTGKLMTTTLEPLSTSYGDNTIVWVVTGVTRNNPIDQKYSIRVKNVIVGGVSNVYTYDVKICQPKHPPACPAGQVLVG